MKIGAALVGMNLNDFNARPHTIIWRALALIRMGDGRSQKSAFQ
jgi:hypothetical protein